MTDAMNRQPEPLQTSRAQPRPYFLWVGALASLVLAVAGVVFARGAVQRLDQMRSRIVLTDESGRARVRLVAQADGGRIELLDERGTARASLRQKHDDELVLSMHRRQEKENEEPLLELHSDPQSTFIAVRDTSGEGARMSGDGTFVAWSNRGSARLGASIASGPTLSLLGEAGGQPADSFEVKVGDESIISGAGKLKIMHDGFVKDLAWRISHTRIATDQQP